MTRTGRPRWGGRVASVLLGLVLGAAIGVLGASPAQAHAVLESSSPWDGQRLTAAPQEVRFVFDEAVSLVDGGTAVLADDGRRVDRSVHLDQGGRAVVVEVDAALPDGAYTAGYRVVSGDGHVVSGAVRFGLNADPAATVVAPKGAAATSLEVVHDATQGLVYLGLALLVGVTASVALVWPGAGRRRRTRVLWRTGWVVLLAGTLVRLFTAGPVADGAGWDGLLRLAGFGEALATTGGIAAAARIAVLALLPLALLLPGWPRRIVVGAGSLALLVSVAVDGHAAVGDDAPAAIVAATLHLAAMSFWLGGLAVLCLVVLAPDSTVPSRLRRWSLSAYLAVAVLVLSGEYLGWRQVQPLDALTTTAYGQVLLVKLGLVTGALALAVVARRLFARPDASRRRLRTAVVAEAVVVAVVVGVTTVLVATPPARTTYGPATTLTAPLAAGRAEIRIEPTRAGVQTVVVRTLDADGDAVAAAGVTATLGSAAVSGIAVPLQQGTDGAWSGAAVVPIPGTWRLTLTVRLAQGTFVTAADYRTW